MRIRSLNSTKLCFARRCPIRSGHSGRKCVELVVQGEAEDVIGDDKTARRRTEDESLVETVRRVVVGFQLTGNHHAARLKTGNMTQGSKALVRIV